jgi:adenine-specific DNA-methyltransferase
MNYIGSKFSLIDFIYNTIIEFTGLNDKKEHIFADLFAGTGVVGSFFKQKGFKVISNDIQYYSYCVLKHYIENDVPLDVEHFKYFNGLDGKEGFIFKNYCMGSGSGRNYFTDENGKKCDAIRIELQRMFDSKLIDEKTYFFYLGSLINSIDKYANTASVYGAFLKHVKKSAQKEFILEPLNNISGIPGEVFNENVNDLINHISGDVLYLDPPYNSRQYYSNYHVLETIAKYDNPILYGKTGLRSAGIQKSDFCSKRTVENSFEDLISKAKFKYVFLSYNNEGLMSLDTIKKIMSKYGDYSSFTKVYKRFKADKDQNRKILSNETTEFLHCLVKRQNNGKI